MPQWLGREVGWEVKRWVSDLPQGLSHSCGVCRHQGPAVPLRIQELGWHTVGNLCLLPGEKDTGDF